MIVAFDPVACEMILDIEDDLPPESVVVESFEFKAYLERGILTCRVGPNAIDVQFYYLENEPSEPRAIQVSEGRWLIGCVPKQPSV